MNTVPVRQETFDPLTAPLQDVEAWLNDPAAPREPSPDVAANTAVPETFLPGRDQAVRKLRYGQFIGQTAASTDGQVLTPKEVLAYRRQFQPERSVVAKPAANKNKPTLSVAELWANRPPRMR